MGLKRPEAVAVTGMGSDDQPRWEPIRTSTQGANGLCHQPAANTAGVINFPMAAGVKHVIGGVAWSYDAAPTGGLLTIVAEGVAIFEVDITAAGPGFFPFSPGLAARRNFGMTITLAAGGAGIRGRLNVLSYWTE